jgi:acyl carrier protein phosphodiesterase
VNYLAHTHLSFGRPAWVAGNFLADVLRGRQAFENLPEDVRQGVALHEAIDEFTDSHPLVRESVALLRPRQGRYAGVVLDILYDHLLARHWERFSETDLDSFSMEAYAAYRAHAHLMPDPVWARLDRMIAHNWLTGYDTVESLRFVFARMTERASFENRFHEAHEEMDRHGPVLETAFLAFYPELIDHARSVAAAFP